MPFDRLLAGCESQSVPWVFFPVQALEPLEYAALKCRIYARTVVLYGEHPIEIHSFGRNVNTRRGFAAVFDGIFDQMVQDLGEYFEISTHLR